MCKFGITKRITFTLGIWYNVSAIIFFTNRGDVLTQDYKYLFILSSLAGGGKSLGIKNKIIEVFEKNDLIDDLEIVETTYEGHVRDAAREFAKVHGDSGIVYACGGDGTLSEVADVLRHTDTSMGVIPAGTANDFAKSIYSDLDLDSIIEKTPFPKKSKIDLIDINGYTCLNVVSLGLDTMVLKHAYSILKRHKNYGDLAYIFGIIRALMGKRYEYLEYEFIDEFGNTIKGSGDFVISAICNGGYYGNGFNPAPDSELDDGLLDVCLVDDMKLRQLFPLIFSYSKGTHTKDHRVTIHKIVSGVIRKPDGEFITNYDGLITYNREIEFKVARDALNLVRL